MRAWVRRAATAMLLVGIVAGCSDDEVATTKVTDPPDTTASAPGAETTAAPTSPSSAPAPTTPPPSPTTAPMPTSPLPPGATTTAPAPTTTPTPTTAAPPTTTPTTTGPTTTLPAGDIGVEQPGSLRLISGSVEVLSSCDSAGRTRVLVKATASGDVTNVQIQVTTLTAFDVPPSGSYELTLDCVTPAKTYYATILVTYADGAGDAKPMPFNPY